jgi:hypothetical protein
VADHYANRSAAVHRALGILALCTATHYGYLLADPGDGAQVWNIAGAVSRSALLLAVVWRWRGVEVVGAALWWFAEEAMVVVCSTAYIVKPWVVPPGQDQCSSLLHFDLGKLGAAVLVCVLLWIHTRR